MAEVILVDLPFLSVTSDELVAQAEKILRGLLIID